MSRETSNLRQIAIKSLQNITAFDPLYRPARFFLAYAKLLEGEAKLGAAMFASITAPVNKEADLIFQEVKENWGRTGLRWSRLIGLVKPIGRLLLPWMELWQEIEVHLRGGTLYRHAEQWSEFDQRLTSWKKAKERELGDALFQLYVGSFSEREDIQKFVKIAAGLTSSAVTADEARETLDLILDKHNLWQFDFDLQRLETELLMSEVYRNLQMAQDALGIHKETSAGEDKLSIIHQLHDNPVGRLFKPGLRKLEELWQAGDWKNCKKLLVELRKWTRSPSEFEAGALLLRALNLPKMSRWLIRFFIPSYTLLDRWRATFRHALFLESEFYYGLSKYQEFTRPSLVEAMDRAFSLHDRFLAGSAPTDMNARRHSELRLLAQCVEACAAVRVALDEQPDPEHSKNIAEVRVDKLLGSDSKLLSDLSRISTDRLIESNVRATALNTLGLLERYKKQRPVNLENSSDTKRELEYFLQALDSKRSPDTCFYIAETLANREQTTEAQLYIDEALRLCPNHAGALLLRQQLLATSGGIVVADQEKH